MPDDGEPDENVILAGAGADIVDDQRGTRARVAVADDADVQNAAAQVPGHDVAG